MLPRGPIERAALGLVAHWRNLLEWVKLTVAINNIG
jgi:hypothetical protein